MAMTATGLRLRPSRTSPPPSPAFRPGHPWGWRRDGSRRHRRRRHAGRRPDRARRWAAADGRREPCRRPVPSAMRLAAAAAVALVLAGCGAAAEPEPALPPAPRKARATETTDAAPPTAAPTPRGRVSAPVRIQIPALKVDAPLIRLGLDSH